MPRPLQCSQDSENDSSRPEPMRLRVICTRPSDVTSATWCLVRSRPRHSTRRRSTRSRLLSSTMSMKSTTMMPPMSRSRSWRTISSAASRLLRVTVCSRLPPCPVNLPGIDVDDRHRLGPIDHERTARRQVHLAVERLQELLVDPVLGEHVAGADPVLQPVGEVRCDATDVGAERRPRGITGDHQRVDVLIEDVPDDLDGQIRLAVEQRRRACGLGGSGDVGPLAGQARDVLLQGLLGSAFRRRSARSRRHPRA